MSKRGFYEIPDVQALTKPAGMGRVYPQTVSASHPGVGQRPRVRAIELVTRPWTASAEPPRCKPSIVIPNDFLTMRPPTEELLDHVAQNFFGYRRKSGGPYCGMDIDALLDSEDARFGCYVPLPHPVLYDMPGLRRNLPFLRRLLPMSRFRRDRGCEAGNA
jgi:hypothetical protein